MSHTAFVAFEAENGFDIHYSHNGGDEYILKSVLEKWQQSGATRRDVFNIPAGLSETAADIGTELQEVSGEVEMNSPPLINPDPTATGVAAADICCEIDTYDTEVVYVVTEHSVRSFVPVPPTPHAFELLEEYVTVDFYRYEKQYQLKYLVENYEKIDPVTVSGEGFYRENLQDQQPWVQEAVTYGHRYILNNLYQLLHPEEIGVDSDIEDAKQLGFTVLDGVMIGVELRDPELPDDVEVHDDGLPVEVTWNNGVPAYPMYFSNGRYGADPNIRGSELRSPVGEHHLVSPSERNEKGLLNQDTILSALYEEFDEDIPTEYTPDKFTHPF